MNKFRINKFFFLLVCLMALTGYSQTLNFNQFGVEQGLPQSGILTMTQDQNGNIWLGTLAGVSKYNGLGFENFSKKQGLAENRVISVLTDRNNNLWFGHWAGGITKYNSLTKTFREVVPKGITLYQNITCIYEDKLGTIWFGTKGQGIVKYVPTDNELKPESTDSIFNGSFTVLNRRSGLNSDTITAINQNGDGTMWIATGQGINKVKDQSIEKFNSKSITTNSITSLHIDNKKNIWIGSDNKGVFKMDPSGLVKVYDQRHGLSSNSVRVIFETINGTIFIGTYGGGVSKYLPQLEQNNYAGPIFQTISVEQGLSNDKVNCIIQDREKNIWIGTALNVNQYFDEQFEIFGKQEGLSSSLIWSVIQDKRGNFWLGTDGGLVKFVLHQNGSQSTFTNYTRNYSNEILNTTALYEDAEGYIWFTHYGNGVSRLDPLTGKITNYTMRQGLASNDVYSIAGDNKGNVWIGTNRGGVSKFNLSTQKFETYNKTNGLSSNDIYTIFKDSKGNLWFGALKGALTMYDGEQFKQFSDKDGYHGKFTLCITEDNLGNLWFGTYEVGIFKYDGKNFRNYTIKDGSSSDTPFLIIADNRNNLWIGNNLGIDKLNLKDESFKHYGRQDGFLGIEINPNAACKDKEGNMWFGSIIGLVKYNSKLEKNNLVEPITYLKDPLIGYKEEAVPADHVYSHNKNHFTFHFVGASLTNPKRVRYQYMLEGLDEEWSPPSSNSFANYPGLDPGSYTFKVRACNNDGIWNKEPVTFSFVIDPPFWKTKWFYALNALVLILIVIVYVKQRERVLKLRNLILEEKVKERTEEISRQKVELEKKNTQITDSIDYAKRIQEAVFIPRDYFQKTLPESFILFKPKDIVSGDFYWLGYKDEKILFAAADCTGHGVPGAFMSIIGYNLLNNIVREKGITKPSLILDEMSKMVTKTLTHDVDGSGIQDGMDIAICAIDTKLTKLEFAGAYNPLYLIRNGSLTEVKADNLPIGKSLLHQASYFTNHTVDIQKGDLIYIFSDGYADQIGGPNRKKFLYGKFRQLLLEIAPLSMEDQKNRLDEAIMEWKGKRDQIDDIMVMGVRF